MGWHTVLMVLLALRYMSPSTGVQHALTFPQNINEDIVDGENLLTLEDYEDEKLEKIGDILLKLIILPWPKGTSPLLYVENYPSDELNEQVPNNNEIFENNQELASAPIKRSRYYRKYPWKRQNSRYDAENRYLCQPSKEDVVRLFVALHTARQGNRGHSVDICNRKRPAIAVFTNMRFLGK